MSTRDASDEHYVIDLCDKVLGPPAIRQATFDWLVGDFSPRTGRSRRLPVDAFWPELGIVVEFQEKQHTESVAIFDRRETVSGVTRGEQRKLYDLRKVEVLANRGLHLVTIHKYEFTVKRDKIVRSPESDLLIVKSQLGR